MMMPSMMSRCPALRMGPQQGGPQHGRRRQLAHQTQAARGHAESRARADRRALGIATATAGTKPRESVELAERRKPQTRAVSSLWLTERHKLVADRTPEACVVSYQQSQLRSPTALRLELAWSGGGGTEGGFRGACAAGQLPHRSAFSFAAASSSSALMCSAISAACGNMPFWGGGLQAPFLLPWPTGRS